MTGSSHMKQEPTIDVERFSALFRYLSPWGFGEHAEVVSHRAFRVSREGERGRGGGEGGEGGERGMRGVRKRRRERVDKEKGRCVLGEKKREEKVGGRKEEGEEEKERKTVCVPCKLNEGESRIELTALKLTDTPK